MLSKKQSRKPATRQLQKRDRIRKQLIIKRAGKQLMILLNGKLLRLHVGACSCVRLHELVDEAIDKQLKLQ